VDENEKKKNKECPKMKEEPTFQRVRKKRKRRKKKVKRHVYVLKKENPQGKSCKKKKERKVRTLKERNNHLERNKVVQH